MREKQLIVFEIKECLQEIIDNLNETAKAYLSAADLLTDVSGKVVAELSGVSRASSTDIKQISLGMKSVQGNMAITASRQNELQNKYTRLLLEYTMCCPQ